MADIILKDKSGKEREYTGVQKISVQIPGGGTKDFADVDDFIYKNAEIYVCSSTTSDGNGYYQVCGRLFPQGHSYGVANLYFFQQISERYQNESFVLIAGERGHEGGEWINIRGYFKEQE